MSRPTATTRPGTRTTRALTRAYRTTFAATAAALLLVGAWPRPVIAALLVPAMSVPALVQRAAGRPMPASLTVHFGAFLTAGPLAGAALGLYSAVPGWDKVVHADSGVLLATAGLALVAPSRRLPSLLVVQASAMSVAAAWEIVEFCSDTVFGTRAQHGNTDTMTDIIAGSLGAAVTLALAWLAARRHRSHGTATPSGRPRRLPQP